MTTDDVIDSLARIVYGGVAITATALHEETGGRELTFPQWRAIMLVGESTDGSRISEVAHRLLGTLSSTGRLLRRLERRGLVTLEQDELDRRATRVRLTPAGTELRSSVLANRRLQLGAIADDVRLGASGDRLLRDLAEKFEARGR